MYSNNFYIQKNRDLGVSLSVVTAPRQQIIDPQFGVAVGLDAAQMRPQQWPPPNDAANKVAALPPPPSPNVAAAAVAISLRRDGKGKERSGKSPCPLPPPPNNPTPYSPVGGALVRLAALRELTSPYWRGCCLRRDTRRNAARA